MASGADHADGDADRDGDVDGGDFLSWQRELGGGGAPPIGAVPEPQSWMLAALAAALLTGRTAVAQSKVGQDS